MICRGTHDLGCDSRAARSFGSALARALIALSVLIAAAASALPARADGDLYARRGPYVAIAASRAMNTFENTWDDALPLGGSVDVADTWGLNARGGYRFAPWFSTELEYEWLDDFRVRAGGIHIADLTTHTVTVNAKFSLPRRVSPYLLVGLGLIIPDADSKSFVDVDTDDVAPCGRLGLGVDFLATPNLVLNLGFEAVVNDVEVETHTFGIQDDGRGLNYVALQFGLGFRF